jgi:SET domain-containing protein
MQRLDSLYIQDSQLGGRGVFSSQFIAAGTLIEICPVIVFSSVDLKLIHQTYLHDYYFLWTDEENGSEGAIALGYGSLYNHSYDPNSEYYTNTEQQTLDIFAIKNIAPGEEITFNYNGMPHDPSPLWFNS